MSGVLGCVGDVVAKDKGSQKCEEEAQGCHRIVRNIRYLGKQAARNASNKDHARALAHARFE